MLSLRRATPWLVVVLLIGGVASYRVFRHLGNGANSPFDRPNHRPASASKQSSADEKSIQAFLALEAQRDLLDRTVWANELSAQKHEDVFVRLWDELRTNEDAFVTLQNFAFGELRLGTLIPGETVNHGITLARLGEPVKRLQSSDWRDLLETFRREGYRLENSEWRHAQFRPETNTPAASIFSVALHGLNRTKQQRVVVRGDIKVTWEKNAAASGEPFPELIDASQLEILYRSREPDFQWTLAREIQPRENPLFIDPLILYDLNGDGLSEIVLGCRNQVYWNQGGGRFQTAKLCRSFTNGINTAILADFTGDTTADFLAADAAGFLLYAGDSQGRFVDAGRRIRFADSALLNPFVMTAGDIDRDGDLDVWLAQYKLPYVEGQMPTPYFDANDGFPSFLLLNEGHGHFQDHTEQAGLAKKRFRRTYSSSFIDLDDDGDLDLIVVSDFAGVDVYFNDGRGRFTEVTGQVINEPHLFGMAHTFGDYDLDGALDCFVIGMNSFVAQRLDALGLGPAGFSEHQQMRPKMGFGNRLYFWGTKRFESTTLSDQVAKSGWSWGATSFDFDNDGDLDLYVVNGHKSRASAKDYESQFWRHDLYVASSNHDRALDYYFRSMGSKLYSAGYSYGGHYKNRLFMNRGGKSFVEVGHLLGVALEADCRNAVSDDLDGDGKMDLLVTTFEEWPQARQGVHLFQNRCPTGGNWVGFRLRESGSGFSPVGAKVTLHTPSRKQMRYLITGDSYRSQHANTAHFGLGTETNVSGVEIRWPNGRTNWISKPAINRYHVLARPGNL